jgi:GNAT superfamily N-acetyltransferase
LTSQAPFRIEPLGKQHDRATFSCGEPELDRYFRQHARQNVERRVAAVFVLVDAASGRVAGYYTLSSGSVGLSDLPRETARKLPRYPDVPVVLMGRLAIGLDFQGQGLGAAALFDALRRALAQSAEVGAMAVVVDAKGDRARAFYERHGFQRFADAPYRLFIPMQTIEALIEAS